MSNEETTCSNRWSHWFATLVFSIVALISLTTSLTGELNDQASHVKWIFSAMIVALCLSGLAVLAHMAKDKFVGTSVEVGLAFIVMAITAAALPAIMKPGNEMAVYGYGGIKNANLYFFSWGTFFTALYIFMHFMQNVYKVKVGTGTKNAKFDKVLWVVLVATSLIVMSSAVRLWKHRDCENLETTNCRRLEYSFSLGVISGVVSFCWLLIGARLPVLADAILSLLMIVLWCLAVAYTTFGDASPAYTLGNLYFSTWLSFIISCRLIAAGIQNVIASMKGEEGGESANDAAEEGAPKDKEEVKDDEKKDDKAGGDDEEAVPVHEA